MKKYPPPFSVRLSPELRQAAERCAQQDNRTVSSLIVWLLTRHLTRQGYLKERVRVL